MGIFYFKHKMSWKWCYILAKFETFFNALMMICEFVSRVLYIYSACTPSITGCLYPWHNCLQHCLQIFQRLQSFLASPCTTEVPLLARISTCLWKMTLWCFNHWSVDQQDKWKPVSQPSCFIALPLSEEVLPASSSRLQCPCLPPKQPIVGRFLGYLQPSQHPLHFSLSLSVCLWQTLVITARTADWVSALATVGTHGNMEGEVDRASLPKAHHLVCWHQ